MNDTKVVGVDDKVLNRRRTISYDDNPQTQRLMYKEQSWSNTSGRTLVYVSERRHV